jgi:hypothetical protein
LCHFLHTFSGQGISPVVNFHENEANHKQPEISAGGHSVCVLGFPGHRPFQSLHQEPMLRTQPRIFKAGLNCGHERVQKLIRGCTQDRGLCNIFQHCPSSTSYLSLLLLEGKVSPNPQPSNSVVSRGLLGKGWAPRSPWHTTLYSLRLSAALPLRLLTSPDQAYPCQQGCTSREQTSERRKTSQEERQNFLFQLRP